MKGTGLRFGSSCFFRVVVYLYIYICLYLLLESSLYVDTFIYQLYLFVYLFIYIYIYVVVLVHLLVVASVHWQVSTSSPYHAVDGSEIRRENHRLDGAKPL